MIPQRDDRLSLLTEENHSCSNNQVDKNKCSSTADERNASRGIELPLEILVDHIAPFLDRRTYNSCLLLCRKAQQTLKSAWWKNGQHQQLPPWPRKLVSRDHSCRVRCLTFTEDNTLMACGCSDGKIRCWDVRLGEFPMISREGHWPDEAVVAVAFGNGNENRLIASSSTDGTIRIWKMSPPKINKTCHSSKKRIPTTRQIDTTTTTSQIMTFYGDDDEYGIGSKDLVPLRCTLCITSDQAVSLHFSPDDLYLVSGHLAVRNARDVITSSTIEIREVRTGLRLRRIEDGGVPVGFLRSSPPTPKLECFHESLRGTHDVTTISEEEHQLIATCGPNTCLKLWSWNRIECVNKIENEETENESPISERIDHWRSNHHLSNEIGEQSIIPVAYPSNLNDDDSDTREHYSTILNNERCVEQWSLDRFSTVIPLPITASRSNHSNDCDESHIEKGRGACEILVAVINEPSKNSFEVWNTNSPNDRKIFCNASPYEIQFSPDGTKIASVDDFNTVKVWRISDGVLLKTFSGGSDDYRSYYNDIIGLDSALDDSDDSSVSYIECDFGYSEDGLFPIHELVFSKDSSTVAVISRCYNEVHLFST